MLREAFGRRKKRTPQGFTVLEALKRSDGCGVSKASLHQKCASPQALHHDRASRVSLRDRKVSTARSVGLPESPHRHTVLPNRAYLNSRLCRALTTWTVTPLRRWSARTSRASSERGTGKTEYPGPAVTGKRAELYLKSTTYH